MGLEGVLENGDNVLAAQDRRREEGTGQFTGACLALEGSLAVASLASIHSTTMESVICHGFNPF